MLVYTLYMPDWAVAYAFSNSTQKRIRLQFGSERESDQGFWVPAEGTNTSLRSGFIPVDASHTSPSCCNCNACCASGQDCKDLA